MCFCYDCQGNAGNQTIAGCCHHQFILQLPILLLQCLRRLNLNPHWQSAPCSWQFEHGSTQDQESCMPTGFDRFPLVVCFHKMDAHEAAFASWHKLRHCLFLPATSSGDVIEVQAARTDNFRLLLAALSCAKHLRECIGSSVSLPPSVAHSCF